MPVVRVIAVPLRTPAAGAREVRATDTLDLLSVTEVAVLLSCSRNTVERIIDRGELPIVDIGNGRAKTRVRRSELEAWIAGRERTLGRTA